MEIKLQHIDTEFSGKQCWVHARGGISPDKEHVVITAQPLCLDGDDVFYGIEMLESHDGGTSWSKFTSQPELGRIKYGNDCEMVLCDATPQWHAGSNQFLLTGHCAVYKDNHLYPSPSPRFSLYSFLNSETNLWSSLQSLDMGSEEYYNCGSGSGQRIDLDNGDILLPLYCLNYEQSKEPWANSYGATVALCSVKNEKMELKKVGNTLTYDVPRGLYEPSLIRVGDDYYMTLRNDEKGYVAHSKDGLIYEPAKEWRFDDGTPIGNYNTQQHWIRSEGRLFLVYTRRGANNDHVFRHRAPLFIAEVDREKLCLIRSTERIAIPERGARLGNFGCLYVSENESWIIAAEWMQTTPPDPFDWKKCMSYGSNNSIWIAKIKF